MKVMMIRMVEMTDKLEPGPCIVQFYWYVHYDNW